jgi:hypothetical protein
MAAVDAQFIGIRGGRRNLVFPFQLDDPYRALCNAHAIPLAFFLIHYKKTHDLFLLSNLYLENI